MKSQWTRRIRRSSISCVGGEILPAVTAELDVDGLLPLALSRPHEALIGVRPVLKGPPRPYAASVARQAAGIVLREIGNVEGGVRELRAAVRLARQAGSREREADARAALGVGLVRAGRTRDGLASLDRAIRLSSGAATGRILLQRGITRWAAGGYAEALDDLRRAVSLLRPAGDPLWTARALDARGLVHVSIGECDRADADFLAAGRLFTETSQELEAMHTGLNRALAVFAQGDLPAALARLEEAAARQPLDRLMPVLRIDRCAILLAAGLVTEALAEADAGVRDIDRLSGHPARKAELLLMAASCAQAAGQPETACARAQAAYRLFRLQQSAWWQARAGLAAAQAQYAAGRVSGQLLVAAGRITGRLEALGSGEAASAHLLAGRIALALGRHADAERSLRSAAGNRRHGSPGQQVRSWVSEALRAEAAGQPRRVLAACRRGLAVLDGYQLTLGTSELRAQATAYGAELAAIAQRHVAHAHRPRQLLAWAERWRATALAVPPVRPSGDAELNASLTALHQVTRQLERARSEGAPGVAFEREQRRLERVARRLAQRCLGPPEPGQQVLRIAELLDTLGPARLAEVTDVDGELYVLVCGNGRVRQYRAGRADDALRAAQFAMFALHRLARPGSEPDGPLAILAAAGPKLQDALLGPASRQLGDGPVVIVPPGRLHTIPWAMLPVLNDRIFSVASSASGWLRARAQPPPPGRRVMLVSAPGVTAGEAEVASIAPLYRDVTVLSGRDAATGQVLPALDGAWLAHIAAPATIRSDSPLFSSLRLYGGKLPVYDLETVGRAPHRLILSRRDPGVRPPARADELLGLASSLLPLGTAGIAAGVAALNDQAAVPVMTALHRCLSAGQTLAEAAWSIRRDARGDPLRQAAAAAMVTLGAS